MTCSKLERMCMCRVSIATTDKFESKKTGIAVRKVFKQSDVI